MTDFQEGSLIQELVDENGMLKRRLKAAEELIGISHGGERYDCRMGDDPATPRRRKKMSGELMVAAERVALAYAYGRTDLEGMDKLRKLVAEATYLDLRSVSSELALVGDLESAQSLVIGDTLLYPPIVDATLAAHAIPAE